MLAHGFGCDQNMWRLTVPALVEHHRVVMFDYGGSGRSDPAAFLGGPLRVPGRLCPRRRGVCEALDLRDVVFVGHSVSAMIGVLAADMAPERIGALVMVAPSPHYLDDEGYRGGSSADDINELLESLEPNYLGWSAAMAPVLMGNADRPELGEELANSFCATNPEMARVFARTTFLSDSRDHLKRVQVPTLILECTQDAIAAREVGAFVHGQHRLETNHPGRHRALPVRTAGHQRGDHRLPRGLARMSHTEQPDPHSSATTSTTSSPSWQTVRLLPGRRVRQRPQAAAVTSLTPYTLRAAALHDPDPVATLTTLNEVLHERYTGGDPRYCTAIFIGHPCGGELQVAADEQGRQPPPNAVSNGSETRTDLPRPADRPREQRARARNPMRRAPHRLRSLARPAASDRPRCATSSSLPG